MMKLLTGGEPYWLSIQLF